jgi:hypothetical protein
MLEIIAASTCAVALTIIVKSHKSDSSKLTESRATMQTIGVQIICGDCSGDDDRPLKTYLGRDGLCGQCGGRSYILASTRFSHSQQLMMARLLEHESVTPNACLEQIESSSRLRTTQLNAVAALDRWSLVTYQDAHSPEGLRGRAIAI